MTVEQLEWIKDHAAAPIKRPGMIRSIIWSLLTVPAILYLPPLISAFFRSMGRVMNRLDRFIRTTCNVLIIILLVSIILGTLWLTLSAYFAPSPWEVM